MRRRKLIVKKGILATLTAGELRSAGGKMKNIGAKRRLAVGSVLSDALNEKLTFEQVVNRLDKEANTPRGRDKRDWTRVAVTELTDAKARASYDLLVSIFGGDHEVYRRASFKCCPKCREHFMDGPNPKKFKLSKVPMKLVGAVHPNCVCGPWTSSTQPDLTKAMDPLADVPIGVVKRVWNEKEKMWQAEISTGTGYWVRMDSPTGKSIVRVVLMHTPCIVVRQSLGFTVLRHGFFKTSGKYTLLDIRKLGGIRYYTRDHGSRDDQELRINGMKDLHNLHDYIAKMQAALPVIATMPDYWDGGAKWKYLTDFMGYKTLADWTLVYPGDTPGGALIGVYHTGRTSIRRAVRQFTMKAVEGDDLKKVTA